MIPPLALPCPFPLPRLPLKPHRSDRLAVLTWTCVYFAASLTSRFLLQCHWSLDTIWHLTNSKQTETKHCRNRCDRQPELSWTRVYVPFFSWARVIFHKTRTACLMSCGTHRTVFFHSAYIAYVTRTHQSSNFSRSVPLVLSCLLP